MSRHKKMYKDSPEMKRDEDGKVKVSQAEKKSAEVNSGTDGMAQQGPLYDRHIKEVSDMHDRHLEERKDMTKRHMKEMKKITPESGQEEIDKTTKGDE